MSPGHSVTRLLTLLRRTVPVVALLLGALSVPSSAVPAEASPSPAGIPIFVAPFQTVGLSSGEAADVQALGPLVATLLADKFSCTTAMTPSDVADMLGLAKDQQVLGTPEEQQIKLENIAGAMGGVLVGGTFSRVGNTYSVSVWASKAGTNQYMDRAMASAQGDAVDAFINLLEKAVNSLDLKVCRPKWTGTITVTEKWDYFLQKPGFLPMLANATRNGKALEYTYAEQTQQLGARIQPYVGTSSSPNKTEAILTHTINESGFIYGLATQDVDCSGSWGRQMRGDFEWRPWMSEWDVTSQIDARDSAEGTIEVNVDRNGHYKITVAFPVMKYKKAQRTFGRTHPTPCEAPRNVESPPIQIEMTDQSRTITIEGDVDPRHPDQLAGETTENRPEWTDNTGAKNSGLVTKKWQLTATSSP